MKFCALICEFNPLHNGHKYIIEKAKEITGLPVLCLMSGNFTQRCEPAIMNKTERAKNAIESGADIVLELPFPYATGKAETFARGAVSILENMGCISSLIFGSESGDLQSLLSACEFMSNEPQEFKQNLQNELQSGASYNTCYHKALLKQKDLKFNADIITKPNNILGIEYLKALQKSKIQPITIKRIGDEFSSATPSSDFASSKTIRKLIAENKISDLKNFIPSDVLNSIEKQPKLNLQRFGDIILFNLKKISTAKLSEYADTQEGLDFRIKKYATISKNYDEFLNQIATKRFKNSRIKRICLHNFFALTKDVFATISKSTPITNILAKKQYMNISDIFKGKTKIICSTEDISTLNTEQKIIFEMGKVADSLYSFCSE